MMVMSNCFVIGLAQLVMFGLRGARCAKFMLGFGDNINNASSLTVVGATIAR